MLAELNSDANFFVHCFRLLVGMEMQEKWLWQTAGEPHSTATELKWGRRHNSLLFGSAPAGRMETVTVRNVSEIEQLQVKAPRTLKISGGKNSNESMPLGTMIQQLPKPPIIAEI